MNYCPNCGASITGTNFCPNCGGGQQAQPQQPQPQPAPAYVPAAQQVPYTAQSPQYVAPISPLSRTAALLLAIFLGFLGVHRFYAGKVGTGILMIFTVGGLGIWWLIDVIIIACGGFRDKSSLLITQW